MQQYECIVTIMIYKQRFLHSDCLRTCQLIPIQCKKMKLSAKKLNWEQTGELKMIDTSAPSLSSHLSSQKQNGGKKIEQRLEF